LLSSFSHGASLRDTAADSSIWLVAGDVGGGGFGARRLDHDGAELSWADQPTDTCYGCAVSPTGDIYVVVGTSLKRYDSGGALIWSAASSPSGRCRIDAMSGDVVVAGGSVARFSSSGSLLWSVSPPPAAWAWIDLGPTGDVVVSGGGSLAVLAASDGATLASRSVSGVQGVVVSSPYVFACVGSELRRYALADLSDASGAGWPLAVSGSGLGPLAASGSYLACADESGRPYLVDAASPAVVWSAARKHGATASGLGLSSSRVFLAGADR
jgi:hypothetical protein